MSTVSGDSVADFAPHHSVRARGFEPPSPKGPGPKPGASASSATPACATSLPRPTVPPPWAGTTLDTGWSRGGPGALAIVTLCRQRSRPRPRWLPSSRTPSTDRGRARTPIDRAAVPGPGDGRDRCRGQAAAGLGRSARRARARARRAVPRVLAGGAAGPGPAAGDPGPGGRVGLRGHGRAGRVPEGGGELRQAPDPQDDRLVHRLHRPPDRQVRLGGLPDVPRGRRPHRGPRGRGRRASAPPSCPTSAVPAVDAGLELVVGRRGGGPGRRHRPGAARRVRQRRPWSMPWSPPGSTPTAWTRPSRPSSRPSSAAWTSGPSRCSTTSRWWPTRRCPAWC